MNEAVGMSDTRLAETKSRTTATDNQRATAHSMNITESLFAGHNLLWEQIMQYLMETNVSVLDNKEGFLREFFSDDEIAIIDLSKISLEDEYELKVINSIRHKEILYRGHEFIMSLIQNDKAKLSTIIEMMKAEDLSEFQKQLKDIEDEIERKEDAIREQEMQMRDKEMEEAKLAREDEQKARLDETYLKGVLDREREHIKGKYMIASYNLQNDNDKDGIPDLMEQEMKYQEFINNVDKQAREVELRQQELEQRKIEHQNEMNTKLTEKEADARLKEQELKIKELEAMLKDRQEREKIKAQKEKDKQSSNK
jgi:hypothetical protein